MALQRIPHDQWPLLFERFCRRYGGHAVDLYMLPSAAVSKHHPLQGNTRDIAANQPLRRIQPKPRYGRFDMVVTVGSRNHEIALLIRDVNIIFVHNAPSGNQGLLVNGDSNTLFFITISGHAGGRAAGGTESAAQRMRRGYIDDE